MSYQRYCEEFALYSSPLEEHLEHEANAQFDDDRERWAAEANDMKWEGMWNEIDMIEHSDMSRVEKEMAAADVMHRYGYTD
jgi:hypothetical protein